MQVSAQNKATYPWPPGERRRGGNPGRQPRPGPTSVLRCPAAGHQRAAPPVAKYWQPVPVRGRCPGPAPLNQQTHNLQVNPFLCGHIGPRIALPKCLTTPADGQGWMGPRQAQRAAALTLSLTHTVTHLWGGGAAEPAQPVWDSRPHWAAGQSPPNGPHGLGKGFTPTLEGGLSDSNWACSCCPPRGYLLRPCLRPKTFLKVTLSGHFLLLPLLQTFQGWVGKKAASLRAV